jgi:hypothetical protein
MRCPDCRKFVSFEESEPEINELQVDADGNVTANVHITNNCADCSQELTEANFDMEADHTDDCKEHVGKGHELSIEDNGCERTERSGYFDKGQFKAAGGRYAKHFYGVELSYTITCSCGKLEGIEGMLTGEIQGSGMDELV